MHHQKRTTTQPTYNKWSVREWLLFSDVDTRYLLTRAGFSTINATIGSQIAWAESRRDTTATHHNTNSNTNSNTDYDLMQIKQHSPGHAPA